MNLNSVKSLTAQLICFGQILLVIPIALMNTQAHAVPTAGSLQQQIDLERERTNQLPKSVTPKKAAPQPLKDTLTQKVTVQSFAFSGNTLLTSQQLNSVVVSYLNRPLSFTELQQAAIDVANAYRKTGWIARAYLPQQDITAGRVTIQIIEAVFGGASLEGESPGRIKAERLIEAVDSAQPTGQHLNADQLDRAILLLNDLPGITVSGSLQKGQGENETDLILKTADEALLNAEAIASNNGTFSTGAERFASNIYLNSPFGIGDQTVANIILSEGNHYARLAYSLPVDSSGLRIGASGSYLNYDLVNGDFSGLGEGSSYTVGVNANYPIIRSRMKNLYFGANFYHKGFDNEFNQQTSTRYNIENLSLSLNGNYFDNFAGGGANSAGLTFTQGYLGLSNQDYRDQVNPLNIDGYFAKFNYRFSRKQVLSDIFSAYIAFSGQVASKNLDTAEKFYIGGGYGVRAYPTSSGGGDDAQLLNVELRTQLPYNINLTGFYDFGHTKINHNNPSGAGVNSYTLQGAGLSLAWQTNIGLNLKVAWAHSIGDKPQFITAYNDYYASDNGSRFWFNVNTRF